MARLTSGEPEGKDPRSEEWHSRDVAATERIGAEFAEHLAPDGIALLRGDLGSGKTVLVRGMASALGVARQEVQSPTYTLIHEHQGERGRLVHVDLYRLDPEDEDPRAWISLGLDELLAGPGLKAIEWPDRLSQKPLGALEVEIRVLADGSRKISARSFDAQEIVV